MISMDHYALSCGFDSSPHSPQIRLLTGKHLVQLPPNGILGHYYKQCLSNMPLNPWSQSQNNEHCAILCHEHFTIKVVHQHSPYHQYFAMNTLPWIQVLAIKYFGTWVHVVDTCHEYTLHRYLPWKDPNSIYAECHAMESSYEKVVLQCASFQICNNHFR